MGKPNSKKQLGEAMARVDYVVAEALETLQLEKDYRFIDLETARLATKKWIEETNPDRKELITIKNRNKEAGTYADINEIKRVMKNVPSTLIRKHVKVSAKWVNSVINGLSDEKTDDTVIDIKDISLQHAFQLTNVGIMDKSGELNFNKKSKSKYDPEIQYRYEASSFLNNKMIDEDIDLVLETVRKAIRMRKKGA